MKIKALRCGKCSDTIFSRATHDFRYCTCGGLFIDGGFDYCRWGGEHVNIAKDVWIEVDATKEELYKDWGTGKDKFGLIKGNKHDKK